MRSFARLAVVAALFVPLLCAKDSDTKIVDWPEQNPVLRFTFGKLREVSSFKGQKSYTIDVSARNTWAKKVERANFTLYLFDKNQVRVGDGWIGITNLGPGEETKFQVSLSSLGTPVTMKLEPRDVGPELAQFAPPRTIAATVYSIPPGASLKIDGQNAGVTPTQVKVSVGRHDLEFSKEGFHTGHFIWNVMPNDVSGGQVTYELGGLSYDTVELRDGTTITGDIISVDGSQVVVRVGGELRPYERNRVKRILLVERDSPPEQTGSANPPK